MAKPAITKRSVKGAALTYDELDANFQNLADASLSLTAGTGGTQVTADLNGNITLVAGTNVTLTGDNTAKTITITASGGGGVSPGQAGRFAYYPTTSSQVDDTSLLTVSGSNIILGGNLNLNGKDISSGGVGNCRIDDDLYFYNSNTGPVGAGILLIRNIASAQTSIGLDSTTVSVKGKLKISATSGSPSNTTTPASWLEVIIDGATPVTYYIPLYQ